VRHRLRVQVVIVAVASSYLTLGAASSADARNLWAPYAAVMFVLAIANLVLDRDA
jgi:hypothetical protein